MGQDLDQERRKRLHAAASPFFASSLKLRRRRGKEKRGDLVAVKGVEGGFVGNGIETDFEMGEGEGRGKGGREGERAISAQMLLYLSRGDRGM